MLHKLGRGLKRRLAGAVSLLSPLAYARAMGTMTATLWRHRVLWRETARQDIEDRYAGQMLGSLWFIIQPVLTMLVFIFVFAFALRVRMPVNIDSTQSWGGYVLYLVSGMVTWISLQEILNRSVFAVTASANLVKQVIFPVEVLPAKMLLSALLTQAISLVVCFCYGIFVYGAPPVTVLLVPALMALQMLLSLGIALLFSALAPFFRDLKDVIQMLSFILMYSMPIFYTLEMLPPWAGKILLLNPFSHVIICWHDVIYWGAFTMPLSWVVFPVFSVISFAVGARVFLALKPMFGNVL
ncbi:MAG: ABC transporter permease [Desulfovibrio sp.]|nr:ABC transporter permease [Desulfovibrio sp.]